MAVEWRAVIRRLFTIASALSLLVCLISAVLWWRSYASGFWIQTSPPGTVYAFKIWGTDATLYRLVPSTPYPNRRAALIQFSLKDVISIGGMIAVLGSAYVLWPRRSLPGHCRSCGYDLRASKDRCPECGTAIPERMASG